MRQAVILVGCAWILWTQTVPNGVKLSPPQGTWSVDMAFKTQDACESRRYVIITDFAGTTLYQRRLPDTIDPRAPRKPRPQG